MVHDVLGLDHVYLRPPAEWVTTLWPIGVKKSPKLFIHTLLHTSAVHSDQPEQKLDAAVDM